MKLSDFDFDLPEALIATRPAKPRSSARLLVAGPSSQIDAHVYDLPKYLLPGDRLILNDTRVIPARLSGQRHRQSAQGPVSAKIEVTLLDPTQSGTWRALVKPLKKVQISEDIEFAEDFRARVVAKADGTAELEFNRSGPK